MSNFKIDIEAMNAKHWPDVRQIYLEGIATGQATFQTEAPSYEDWDRAHLPGLRYVATYNNEIAGWVTLSPVSARLVYAGVAEVSIYIAGRFRAQGIGFQLLTHLIAETERHHIWTLQAGIFPENTASIKLHEKLGFRLIGYREKIGKINGTWRNVNLLERRSKRVGMD